MTKQEIIAKYERKTGKKAFTVLGDLYIYMFNDGKFCFKKHSFLNVWNKKEVYSIGVYAMAFFNGMVDIKRIDKKGNEHDIYYGRYKN